MATVAKEKHGTEDALTGLRDYEAFMTALDQEIAKAQEESQDLCVAMADIDSFKKVNDQYGHIAGDEVIKATARHLSESIADHGRVFRYGGDEFAILLPGTEKEQAFLLLEQVRTSLDRGHPIETDKGRIELKIVVSAGISSYPEDGNRLRDIVRKADGALHRAKTSGRNRVCLSRQERMVTKTSHYMQEQLEQLSALAKREGVGDAVLLREALDDLLKKYDDQLARH